MRNSYRDYAITRRAKRDHEIPPTARCVYSNGAMVAPSYMKRNPPHCIKNGHSQGTSAEQGSVRVGSGYVEGVDGVDAEVEKRRFPVERVPAVEIVKGRMGQPQTGDRFAFNGRRKGGQSYQLVT